MRKSGYHIARSALVAAMAALVLVPTGFGQPGPASASPANASTGAQVKSAGPPSGSTSPRFSRHASDYYQAVWAVDGLRVKLTESGELMRFSCRVVDPDKASVLSNQKAEPSREDSDAGVSLVVPTMENIGQLCQSEALEARKFYWMAFSNKGRLVKRGHRVNVVIGPFRANRRVVE